MPLFSQPPHAEYISLSPRCIQKYFHSTIISAALNIHTKWEWERGIPGNRYTHIVEGEKRQKSAGCNRVNRVRVLLEETGISSHHLVSWNMLQDKRCMWRWFGWNWSWWNLFSKRILINSSISLEGFIQIWSAGVLKSTNDWMNDESFSMFLVQHGFIHRSVL
jgi:hypothetical protein